jgi:transposase-like protein
VAEKATRRRFTADYKLRVLREADACQNPGDVGRLLRREGLYSSHLVAWRRQQKSGELQALAPRQRGPRAKKNDPLVRRNVELERENRRLRRRLEQAETIIDIQKKASALLGIPLNHRASDEND